MIQSKYDFQEVKAMVEQGHLITMSDIAGMYPDLSPEIIEKAVRRGDIDQPIRKNFEEYYWAEQISLFSANYHNYDKQISKQ